MLPNTVTTMVKIDNNRLFVILLLQVKDNVTELLKRHQSLAQQVTLLYECKICKMLPVGTRIVVTCCCNQLFGCNNCFMQATEDDLVCPLCRATDVASVDLKGFDDLIVSLAQDTD